MSDLSRQHELSQDRAIKALRKGKAALRRGVVTAVSPLEVSVGGGSSLPAFAVDGCALSVNDQVSVIQQGSQVVVQGRLTDDPVDAGSVGGPFQPLDSDLTAIAALTTTSFGRALLTQADAAATRGTIGVVIGTDVQAYDSDLAAIAALSTTSFGRSLLTQANAAAALATIGAAASSHTHAQSDITGLTAALALLAPLASPALTGNPTAPTQTAGNNSTRIATTAYADGAVSTASTADRARSNHTGTQTASTISDFDAQVRTNRLDQMTAPGANIPMNTKKLTGLLQGSVAGDSAEYSQMVAGDAAAQLGFTLKAAVSAVSIAALPAHGRSGDVLTASANGFLAPSFGSLKFSWTSGGVGSGNGQFKSPFDVALDSSGNIFVLDRDNSRVQKFNSSGVYQAQFSVSGSSRGMAIDSSDRIYVADIGGITRYSSAGTVQASFNITGSGAYNFNGGMAIDASGNLFLPAVDILGGCTVQKYNSSGVYQSQFGSAGTGNGQFKNPQAVACDSSGNIYVADTDNNRVQKFNSSGTYQSQFGSAGSGDGQFYSTTGIEIDSSGNIWAADYGNNRIQKFNSSGTFQAKYGSAGTGNGQFIGPRGFQVTSAGDLIAADQYNHRIQKFVAFSLSANDTVLVRHEGSGTSIENSIYTVTDPGSASTKWVLTLRADMATGYAKNQSMVIALTEDGAQNRVFVLNAADPITVWTTALTWSRFEPGGPPSLHALTHAPGGPDPILTGIPVAVGAANSEGTADSFARSDHVHKLDAPGCRVYRSTNQSISNATGTAISFNQERYDPDSMHDTSTNPSRITIGKAGVYQVVGNIRTAANTTGVRELWLAVNGSTTIGFNALTASATDSGLSIMQVTALWKFAATDYVEMILWQNSGGSLNVEPWSGYSPELSVHYVGVG